jgi:small multidrug resistance pump
MKDDSSPKWMKRVLVFAGLYNLLWCGWIYLFPTLSFTYSGYQRNDIPVNYPNLWQGIGVLIGIFGMGYLVASINPLRYWPIVFIGLLSKLTGPFGYIYGLITDTIAPWNIIAVLFNDIIWSIFFYFILRQVWKNYLEEVERPAPLSPEIALSEAKTQYGQSLTAMSYGQPTLLVFLRHFG